jgi:hypothetical protein
MYEPAELLRVGDVFSYAGTEVTVLADRQPWEDLFGREMFAYHCRRADTGAEGLVPFGPGGKALLLRKGGQQ